MTASASGLPVSASSARVDHAGRLVGVVGDPLHGGDVPFEQVLDDVGVLLEELGADEQHGGRELAVLPQVRLVDEHVRARVEDQPRHPRLGKPRAVDVALLEQGQRLGVLGRRDAHVAAARGVGLEPLVREPAAQRDILRVAELRRRERRALEVGRRVDPVADDERGAAGRRAGDDARRLAGGLDERVDRRVRPDVGRVDRAGRQRLDRGGAGVEDGCRHVDVAEGVGEEPLLEADERRRVRDVGEVAEAQLGDCVLGRGDVLPAAEAQPAIIMATSPRVVIVVAVRMLFTVRLLQVGISVGWCARDGSVAHDAGGESRAVGRMDDEERAPVAVRAVRLERQVGREAQARAADVVGLRASRRARG